MIALSVNRSNTAETVSLFLRCLELWLRVRLLVSGFKRRRGILLLLEGEPTNRAAETGRERRFLGRLIVVVKIVDDDEEQQQVSIFLVIS